MTIRAWVAASRAARLAAVPQRAAAAGHHMRSQIALTTRWLALSKEHHNFTYHLEDRNVAHLAWWVSLVTSAPPHECRGFMDELLQDQALREHVETATRTSVRRGLADTEVRFGRRVGWYALVRAMKPGHVVETGTDKGLGSLVIAAALLRNGRGSLTTIDINPQAGYLLASPYSDVVDIVVGDSLVAIQSMPSDVDLFIHDSDHADDHEALEFQAIEPKLLAGARVLSDNAHASDSLMNWAAQTHKRFTYFQERPRDHWYPGAGIGAAW